MPIGSINRYLDETLFSIDNQTYKNIELIVACDYSIQDELIEIMSKYKFKSYIYPLYLSGIGFARNVTLIILMEIFLHHGIPMTFQMKIDFKNKLNIFLKIPTAILLGQELNS